MILLQTGAETEEHFHALSNCNSHNGEYGGSSADSVDWNDGLLGPDFQGRPVHWGLRFLAHACSKSCSAFHCWRSVLHWKYLVSFAPGDLLSPYYCWRRPNHVLHIYIPRCLLQLCEVCVFVCQFQYWSMLIINPKRARALSDRGHEVFHKCFH